MDAILGVGGLPRGRVCEIYGPEASGKTTLALHIIAEAQRRNGTCVFVDAEHALDRYGALSASFTFFPIVEALTRPPLHSSPLL